LGNIADNADIDHDGFYHLPIGPDGMPDWSKVDTGVTVDSHHIRAARTHHDDYQSMPFDAKGISPSDPATYDVFHRATLEATHRINSQIQEQAKANGVDPRYVTPKQVQAVIWLKHKADRLRNGDAGPNERELDKVARIVAHFGPDDASPYRPEREEHELPTLWRKMLFRRSAPAWEDQLTAWVEHFAPGGGGPQNPLNMQNGDEHTSRRHADVNINITDDGNGPTPQQQGPCGPGMYYDPLHSVCQPYPPAAPPPGYNGFGENMNGYYDPVHGVTTSYPAVTPPAFYNMSHRRAEEHHKPKVKVKASVRLLVLPKHDLGSALDSILMHAEDMFGRGHQSSMHTALPRKDFQRLLNEARKGGFTVHNHVGDGPTDGYMVSFNDNPDSYHTADNVIPAHKIRGRHIKAFTRQNRDLLRDPRNHLGAWLHKGNVYLDVSRHHPSLNEAIPQALKERQLGIYDLNNGATLPTRATAKMTGHLPMEASDEYPQTAMRRRL
jgi:hypothetical protein